MLFSSLNFFVFFIAYFAVHLLIARRYRVYLIIGGSTIFYAWWNVAYVWVPYLLMGIALGGSLWVSGAPTPRSRRLRLVASLLALFAPLAVFKYTDFIFRDVLGAMFGWSDALLAVPLPLGISFVTFTLTAFVVDTVTGKFRRVARPSTVLAYVLFFPHLIAGPILRPAELIPQLENARRPILPAVAVGIFTLGLVKKVVFADSIAPLVDVAYAKDVPSAAEALFALYGFAAQIYCDFSGYTDMAVGLGMLLGVRLPTNFLRPYSSVSLVDFWRRWHITLSHWLRDYLYIPLGGNRRGFARQLANLAVTMVLGGLWHGANWTFVIWGALHGVALAAVHALRRLTGARKGLPLPRPLGLLLTFHFVAVAWVFFRAPNVDKATGMLGAAMGGSFSSAGHFVSLSLFPILLTSIVFLLHRFDDHRRVYVLVRRVPALVYWVGIGFFWLVAVAVSQGSSAKFIYFDF